MAIGDFTRAESLLGRFICIYDDDFANNVKAQPDRWNMSDHDIDVMATYAGVVDSVIVSLNDDLQISIGQDLDYFVVSKSTILFLSDMII